MERRGRGSRFTADGEKLLGLARNLLALHDEGLRSFGHEARGTIVIGSTEHAAAQLLPHLATALAPRYGVKFRIDRGTKLRESFATGRIDLALLIGPADDPRATPVGDLALTWYSAPGWTAPRRGEPLPVVAFDDPCALRDRALVTLAHHSIPVAIAAEANQLAGVQAAVSAGAGVALLATLGQTPAGLVPRDDLPRPSPLPLALWTRQGVAPAVSERASDTLRALLSAPVLTKVPSHDLVLAKGA